jgi:hypothetical protein
MAEREETTGRYCLPVRQSPAVMFHPAVRIAAAVQFLALMALVATDRHARSLSSRQHLAVEVVFMLCSLGYFATIIWVQHRGGTRHEPDHASGSAG